MSVYKKYYRIVGYFRGVHVFHESTANPRKLKNNVEEARFSISIREITFREQELNWLFVKYKRLENNMLAIRYKHYIYM